MDSDQAEALNFLPRFKDQINGTYACENDKMLNNVLKREYDFQGFVVTDWDAQHSTQSAVAGLDVRCFLFLFGLLLTP